MKHFTQTNFGTSEAYYSGADKPAFHGVGQGNGTAPAIWAVVSSPILNVQREAGFGMQIQSPLSKEHLQMAGYAFVDDTDLCQAAQVYDTSGQVISQLQAALDCWHGSLWATGGDLEPSKNFGC